MDIQATVSGIQSFSELLPIVERAEAKVSSWGRKYVCVPGYEGTLHINALAGRVLEILKQNKYEFDESQRKPGKRLAKRIDQIYDDGSMRLGEKGYFIIIVNILGQIFDAIFNWMVGRIPIQPRWNRSKSHGYWSEILPNKDFYYYTQTQLQNVFNISPELANNMYKHKPYDGIMRWKVVKAKEPPPIPGPRVYGNIVVCTAVPSSAY